MKQLIKELRPYVKLYRDQSGLAWIEDGTCGLGYSCHPNIDARGSVAGMRNLGYWGKRDRIVQSHGFKYNIDHLVVTSEDDEAVRQACQCGGAHN